MVGFHFGGVNGQLRIKLDGSNNPFKINARMMNFVALKYTAHHEHGTSGANWKVGKVGQVHPLVVRPCLPFRPLLLESMAVDQLDQLLGGRVADVQLVHLPGAFHG